METLFAIFYEHKLLIVVDMSACKFSHGQNILDWYTKKYAFDRNKLSGAWIDSIKYEE
jgi:hypothetical protein